VQERIYGGVGSSKTILLAMEQFALRERLKVGRTESSLRWSNLFVHCIDE
jgi:hypothetical protein